jgi:hypothetical protein
MWVNALGWAGASLGVAGNFALAARHPRISVLHVLCVFLLANTVLLLYAVLIHAFPVVAEQTIFAATNVFGIWRHTPAHKQGA